MYTIRMESKKSLKEDAQRKSVVAEIDLIKKLQCNAASNSNVLPLIVITFQDEKALYTLFACRSLATLQRMRQVRRVGVHPLHLGGVLAERSAWIPSADPATRLCHHMPWSRWCNDHADVQITRDLVTWVR